MQWKSLRLNFSVKIRGKLFGQGCHYSYSCSSSSSSSSNGKLNFPQADKLESILAIFQGAFQTHSDTLCCNDSRKNLSASVTWHLLCHTRKRINCTRGREREADEGHANLWKIPDKINNIFVGLVGKFIIANNRLFSDESK